jgi:hypothetical protein
LWRAFYEIALEVLVPFPEPQQEVERRIAVNEPCIFRPDWRRTVTGADFRFFLCKQTLWAALEKFPEARQVLDQALIEAFGDEATDGEESPVEKHPSQGSGDGGRAPGDAPAGPRDVTLVP